MNYPRTAVQSVFASLFLFLAATRSWAVKRVDNGFLREKDFRVSMDTAYSLFRVGLVKPATMDFDFSASGDTGVSMRATGRVFATAWKSKCKEPRGSCDFFLTVQHEAKDSASLPVNGSELHARIFSMDSTAAIEISTKIIQDYNYSKLESDVQAIIGDSIAERNTSRKAGVYRLTNVRQGYELKLSMSTTLGKQRLSLYSRQIDGNFKLAQAKVNLPEGFSADSIAFLITDPNSGTKNILSEAYAGFRTWNRLLENEADYLKKISKGARPGNLTNFDYFGQALFHLIKSTEDPGNPFGTWEDYKENTKMLQNISGGGELLPVQLIRTSFHEKGANGAVIKAPFFLCASPRQKISSETADLFLDPASIFGESQLKEIKVTNGNATKTLTMGQKMKIDFKDGLEKRLDLEIVYADGFKANVPLMFRGPEKN